jgi:hypothetical protein
MAIESGQSGRESHQQGDIQRGLSLAEEAHTVGIRALTDHRGVPEVTGPDSLIKAVNHRAGVEGIAAAQRYILDELRSPRVDERLDAMADRPDVVAAGDAELRRAEGLASVMAAEEVLEREIGALQGELARTDEVIVAGAQYYPATLDRTTTLAERLADQQEKLTPTHPRHEQVAEAASTAGHAARRLTELPEKVPGLIEGVERPAETQAGQTEPTEVFRSTTRREVTLSPGKYTLEVGETGEVAVTPVDASHNEEPPRDLRPAIQTDPDVNGVYTITTADGVERVYAEPNRARQAVIDYLMARPDQVVPRDELSRAINAPAWGQYLNYTIKRVNSLSGQETFSMIPSIRGESAGVRYNATVEIKPPEPEEVAVPAQTESVEASLPKGTIVPLGDPDLHVYVMRHEGRAPKAIILPLEDQRRALEVLRSRPNEDVPLDELKAEVEDGKGLHRHMRALEQHFRYGEKKIITKNTEGDVTTYRYHSGVDITDAPGTTRETTHTQEPEGIDVAGFMAQLQDARPGPMADVKERIAWSAAMASLQRAKDLGILESDPKRKHDETNWRYDDSPIAQGVEKVYEAIARGEVAHRAEFGASDLPSMFGVTGSPPTLTAIMSRLHAMGFVTAPGKGTKPRVDARYIQ